MKPRLLVVLCLLLAPVICRAVDQDYAGSIDPFLQEQFHDRKSCMVIGLVDTNGSQVFSGGKLDNGTDGKPDGDTVFFIGSVSKTFTALLLADMAQRNEVQLDDPAAKYLPVTLPTFNGKEITLLDLATHAADLPVDGDNMAGQDTRQKYESYSIAKMEEFVSKYTLKREPGAEFSYSNVGMALLGDVLARKAKTDYGSLVTQRICQPLGMTSTCTALPPEQKARLAMGHEKNGDPSTPWQLQAYLPAGGILSTANDLLKYASAQAGLTTSELTPAIEKTHIIRHIDTRGLPEFTGNGTFGKTAMDWIDHAAMQPPGTQMLGHAGGAGSYHAFVGFDMKQHRGVVVLSTDNGLSVECVGWNLLQKKALNANSGKEFEREMVGIGVALDLDKQTKALLITRVFPNSPAAKAGLSAGCIINRIDDTPLAGKDLLACAKLLRGSSGTKVMLEITDPQGKSSTIEVNRQTFVVTPS